MTFRYVNKIRVYDFQVNKIRLGDFQIRKQNSTWTFRYVNKMTFRYVNKIRLETWM